MTPQTNEYIDKCLSDILFNGCKIPSVILKGYFETACMLAQNERAQEISQAMFGSEPDEHNIM
jgi:hypothetical protein